MLRRVRFNTKGLGLLFCALVVSLAAPCWQMIAFADNNESVYVRLLNATISTIEAGGATAYNATWHINNNDVTLGFHSGLAVEDIASGKAIPFANSSDILNGLGAQAQGDFCSSYIAELTASDGYGAVLSCDYDESSNYSDVSLAQHLILPAQVEYFTLEVKDRSQSNPRPGDDQGNMLGLVFENVDEYDETEGKYVIVHSTDQSLAGKSFRIDSQDAQITAHNEDQSVHYSVDLEHDAFFASSYAVSGDFDPETAQVTLIGIEGYEYAPEMTRVGNAYVFSMNGIHFPGNTVYLAIQDKHEIQPHDPDEPQPHAGVETHSSVTVHSSEGYDNPKSFYHSWIIINDGEVFDEQDCMWNDTNCAATYQRDDVRYNKEENANTVELQISTLFIYKVVNKVVVNNVEYNVPIDYSNRADWLAHYDHQAVGFELEVPYAESYDITIDTADTPGDEQVIGNFLWTNDENEKTDPEGRKNDAYIGHSHLEVVGVRCHITENDADDVFFNVEAGEPEPEGCVFEYEPDDEDHNYGSLVVPEGSEVTVRLKTEYGYQVTSFGINDNEIAVDEGKVAEYTFGIFRGNFHLGAVVEKTSDEVNASSSKIRSGSIKLGGEEIDEGTAMLTVGDADLTDEEKAQFQNEAGNYNISTYLDIDLDQIFYNGHGGYWKGAEMKELEQEAEISLVLEEGVDGNEVIIVHKKHDGSYELIPTTYNAATHTITFKTSSFSDYAIGSKTVAKPVSEVVSQVNTLDNVLHYVAMFAACSILIIAVAFKNRSAKTTK